MASNAVLQPELEIAQEIGAYWDERAASYSEGVLGELHGEAYDLWVPMLKELSADVIAAACAQLRIPKMADLGCGPGFMSVIFSRMGCECFAVDGSSEMLATARANVAEEGVSRLVSFYESDVLTLPFPSDYFDFAVLRNVTWLMREPHRAYAEWLRVLRPGGKLIIFDANWYRYLIDPAVNAQRVVDQADPDTLGWEGDITVSDEQERRCEQIALQLPLTKVMRPAWDYAALHEVGFSRVRADDGVWQRLWTEGEKAFYATSPMFAIEAWK